MVDAARPDIALCDLNLFGLLVATQYVTYPQDHAGKPWSDYRESEGAEGSDLIGWTIIALGRASEDSFYVAFSNGAIAAWFHMRGLMDRLHISSIDGDIPSLVGARLLGCETKATLESVDPADDMRTTRFSQRLTTAQGHLTIEWEGVSDRPNWSGPTLVIMEPLIPRSAHVQIALLQAAKAAAR